MKICEKHFYIIVKWFSKNIFILYYLRIIAWHAKQINHIKQITIRKGWWKLTSGGCHTYFREEGSYYQDRRFVLWQFWFCEWRQEKISQNIYEKFFRNIISHNSSVLSRKSSTWFHPFGRGNHLSSLLENVFNTIC